MALIEESIRDSLWAACEAYRGSAKSVQGTEGGAIMTTDSFDALDHRLLSVMSRLQCVVENFGDFTGMQNELHPAAFVLAETTENVVQLYRDLQAWHVDHERTPKPPTEVQS